MASSSETARAYFAALSDHDVDAAVAFWKPGGVDRIAGEGDLVAPAAVRGFFEDLFGAFPDWRFEILETTTQRERCAVRWRVRATFAGPGRLQGVIANGGRVELEGIDVLTVREGQIVANHAFVDRAELLSQLGVLPAPGSAAERGITAVTNVRHRGRRSLAGSAAKVIAPGVWQVSGGLPATMNVYLLAEPDGGVTVFDAGVRSMTSAVAAAGARLGGIRRVILGHADCDHRGGAAGLGAPVYTHPLEAEAARSAASERGYWQLSRLAPHARLLYPWLLRAWDGGPLEVAGTVQEGDQVAGFEVIDLPGHAPGLIGLLREEDGLAIASDVLYTINVETALPARPQVPHPGLNHDTDEARRSLHKLAERAPRVVWLGHSRPVSGPDVVDQLLRAAQA
jgi:glyoxylase-like metal-dependent hydrolase (beta-lactamase superfamily II)/predicted ester cyclase